MKTSNFTVRRCERSLYEDTLNMLNIAFNNGENWFQKNLGNCTPWPKIAEDDEIDNHWIALDGKRVVGCLGAYPLKWVVSDGGDSVTLETVGIGQVSCDPEYRNNGIMSLLLSRALEEMRENKTEICWLQGDKFRYGNFGIDFAAGNSIEYHFSKKRIQPFMIETEIEVHNADGSDIDLLSKIYESYPSRIVRNRKFWNKQLSRENLAWIVTETEKHYAYICYEKGRPKNIYEIWGDNDIVLSMLNKHMAENSLEDISLQMPLTFGTSPNIFFKSCSGYFIKPIMLAGAIDIEALFAKLKPFAEKQCKWDSEPSEKDKLLICKKLLGYIYSPDTDVSEFCKNLKPLTFWLPLANNV